MGEQPRERDGRYGEKIEVGVAKRLTDALRAAIGHDGSDGPAPDDLGARLAAQQATLVAERPVEVAIKADPLAEEVEVGGWLCADLLDVATALDVDETKAAERVVTARVPTASMAIIAESLEWLADETKRDFTAEARGKYADAGIALPDKSYPIPDRDALHRAIQSYGRGNTDKAVVKRHIIKRARALNALSMLPDDWNVEKGWAPWEHPEDPDGDEAKRGGWDPAKHPRDAQGKWASAGMHVRLTSGATGRVVGTPGGGQIEVEQDRGGLVTVPARNTRVTGSDESVRAMEASGATDMAGMRRAGERALERQQSRITAESMGFTNEFGRLSGEQGTLRTTNGAEVTGKLTSHGATFGVDVEGDDGRFTRVSADRVAGVKLGESTRTPHFDTSEMTPEDVELARENIESQLAQTKPDAPIRRLYEEMLADLGPKRLVGAALEAAIREQTRRRSGVGRPFGRTAAEDLAPSKSAPWLQAIEDAEAAFEADFGDPEPDEEKLFRRARGKAPKWDPGEHPRDSHGRFASVGATVKLPGGGSGRVTGTAPGGKIKVRRSDGAELTVDAKQTTVTRGPQASAAADTAEKIRQKITGDKPEQDRAEVRRQGQEEGARQAAAAMKPKPAGKSDAQKYADDYREQSAVQARAKSNYDRLAARGKANTPEGKYAAAALEKENARKAAADAELAKPGPLDAKLVNYKPERDLADLSKTEPLADMLPNAREVAYSKTPFIEELHRRMGITDADSHDMGDYLNKRNALFEKQPLQEVPFDDVVVTQPRVRGERVQQIRDHPETGGTKPQHFVRFNGETYVMNGHHRVAAQMLDGDKGAVGRVLDLDQHPKDDGIDRGSWTGGAAPNGADGQGTRPDGSAWGTGYPDGDPRQDPAYDQYTKALDDKIDDKLATLRNTQERYDRVDGKPKAYTAERQALHERILDDQMEKYKNVPKEYKAVVMAGPPGAGKSTVIKTNGGDFGVESDSHGDPTNFATVNPDELKGELLNYGAVPDEYFDTGISPAEGAAFTHEESSDLAERLAARLRADGYNIIMDGTFAGKPNKQVAKVHTLRDAGYEVTGVLVDGTVEKSLQNAGFRHSRAPGAPPATPGGPYRGRYVSIDLIEGNKPTGDVDSKVFGRPHRNASSENIERVQDAFDGGVIWYDNQTGESKKAKSTVPSPEAAAIRKMDALDRRIAAVSDEKVKERLRRELEAMKNQFDFDYDSLALAWMRRGWGELETKVADALGDSYAELLAEEYAEEVKAEGGADKNRGNAERLRRYWTHGEGAASIRWGEAGDHMRCVRQLVQHGKFRTDQAHGYCNLREKEATGKYPAQHAAASKAIQWLDGLVEVKADTGLDNVNPEPTGVMVALYPPDDVAAALSLKTGVPAEELHVTLAYLGEVADVGDRLDDLVSVVADFGDDSYDLSGEVSGLGRFSNTDDPAGDALVALVDAPDLTDFHVDIVDALEDAGFEVRAEHGFTPHMTLAYIGAEEKLPLARLEPVPITFGALSVAVGGDVWDFPLHPADGTEDQHRSGYGKQEGEGDAPYDKGKAST